MPDGKAFRVNRRLGSSVEANALRKFSRVRRVSRLPLGALVEIDAVAKVNDQRGA